MATYPLDATAKNVKAIAFHMDALNVGTGKLGVLGVVCTTDR